MSIENKEYENIILGTLFHDIGKFWQGTGKKGDHEDLCREFIINFISEAWQGSSFASLHGDLNKFLENEYYPLKMLMISDYLSSQERTRKEEKGKRIEEPLRSIFHYVKFQDQEMGEEYYYQIKKLELNKNIYPQIDKIPLKDEYNILWDDFTKEIENIKDLSTFNSYFNTLINILEKYTWSVPSVVYKDIPDISLFSHLKTTCAISSCLYKLEDYNYLDNLSSALYLRIKIMIDLEKKNVKIKEFKEKLEEDFENEATDDQKSAWNSQKFILICGDISGVQNFIYTISSKGAIKGLRGRSLYLQLLTEILAKYVIKELDLPITNILYCGGGNFFILAPINAKEIISIIKENITKILLKYHKGDLYLALSLTEINADDFYDFGKKFDECTEKLVIEKKLKFSSILEDEFDTIFEMQNGELCDVCKNEEQNLYYKDNEGQLQKWKGETDKNKFCEMCISFEDLADYLKDAKYLIEIQDVPDNINIENAYESIFKEFGFKLEFKKSLKNTNFQGRTIIYSLNNTDFLNENTLRTLENNLQNNLIFGFKFLAKTTPIWVNEDLKDNKIKRYYQEYACKLKSIKSIDAIELQSIGIKRIGILRMDVDNLGKMFAMGLESRSISRISTLSSMLSTFFNGYLNNIVEDFMNNRERKNQVYVIYSGGDDLFIIGCWDLIIDLAEEIYNNFREFTCKNQNITISCGISIVDAKFPMYKGAELAKEALEEAKKIIEKNRINIFNNSFKWDIKENTEYKNIIELKSKIINALKKNVPRTLLYRISETYSDFKNFKKEFEERRYSIHRKWILNYYLLKFQKKYKEAERELKNIEELYDKVIWNNINWNNNNITGNSMIIPVAVKWAELLTRGEKI